MRPGHWLPAVLWMVAIFALGSDAASGEHTSRIVTPMLTWLLPGVTPLQIEVLHQLLRKVAHVTEYAVLGTLWFRALASGRGWPAWAAATTAFAISVGWAGVDEAHQLLVPSRTSSLADVGIDAAGALAAVLTAGWRRTVRGVAGVLL